MINWAGHEAQSPGLLPAMHKISVYILKFTKSSQKWSQCMKTLSEQFKIKYQSLYTLMACAVWLVHEGRALQCDWTVSIVRIAWEDCLSLYLGSERRAVEIKNSNSSGWTFLRRPQQLRYQSGANKRRPCVWIQLVHEVKYPEAFVSRGQGHILQIIIWQ